jgi:glucose/arabinose dehydrogenase
MIRLRYLLILIGVCMLTAGIVHAQPATPACMSNFRYPRVPPTVCGEILVDHLNSQGMISISSMVFGPDGSLYFARPATSEIMRLKPDGAGFFESPQVFASQLPEPPNGLTYYEKAWYVSGDTTIVRLRDQDNDGTADDQQILVGDLPGESGGWLGNIRVGPDKRLYVAKASSCDACTETDPRRAALLSFALDGSDPQIVARGLKDSYDFDWDPGNGTLYIVDNERSTLPGELNALPTKNEAVSIPDFGWPRCGGDLSGDCAGVTAPILTFAAGSRPTGTAFYPGNVFTDYPGGLLVTLAGSWNAPTTVGYALMLITFKPDGTPNPPVQFLPYNPGKSLADTSLYTTSFYPDHPAVIAISREGWIYISLPEGRIYRFRPRQ